MALWECLVGLVRTIKSEAWRLQEVLPLKEEGPYTREVSDKVTKRQSAWWSLELILQFLIPWEVNWSQELPKEYKRNWLLSKGLTPTWCHFHPKNNLRFVYSTCILPFSITKKTPSGWNHITPMCTGWYLSLHIFVPDQIASQPYIALCKFVELPPLNISFCFPPHNQIYSFEKTIRRLKQAQAGLLKQGPTTTSISTHN